MKIARIALIGPFLVGVWMNVQAASFADDVGPYLRAEGGFSKARDAGFRDNDPNSADCFLIATVPGNCNGGVLNHLGNGFNFGAGVGYKFPGGIRADISFNHRGGYDLKGRDPAGTDFDPAVKSDSVMINGAFDLPVVMGSIRPFIGAGIGWTRNEMKALKWNEAGCCTGTLTGGKKNDTVWQLTLGADIALDRRWTLEVLYRYTDMGEFVKNAGPDQDASNGGPFNASGNTGAATGKLRSNEFIVGVRWKFM
jgi:opacity protein-like surface antigen